MLTLVLLVLLFDCAWFVYLPVILVWFAVLDLLVVFGWVVFGFALVWYLVLFVVLLGLLSCCFDLLFSGCFTLVCYVGVGGLV